MIGRFVLGMGSGKGGREVGGGRREKTKENDGTLTLQTNNNTQLIEDY